MLGFRVGAWRPIKKGAQKSKSKNTRHGIRHYSRKVELFCKPFYNSFISTFCYQFTHDEEPKIIIDTKKKLIYIDNLVKVIFEILHSKNSGVSVIKIPFDVEKNVSEIFLLLNEFYKKFDIYYNNVFLFDL